MKKWIAYILALAMALSLAGCGSCEHAWQEADCKTPKTCTLCGETQGETADHTAGQLEVASVDTEALSVTYELKCSVCGEALETKTASTGIAPTEGVMPLSAAEWNACLDTVRQQYGASQTLYPYPAEAEDNALLHAMVSMSQMFAVFSYRDKDGNVITTDRQDERNLVHNIYIEAQFTNDNAKEFLMLLMLTVINNNASLEMEDVSSISNQIMSGYPVEDNGYTYAMEIISSEDHKVGVSITAE